MVDPQYRLEQKFWAIMGTVFGLIFGFFLFSYWFLMEAPQKRKLDGKRRVRLKFHRLGFIAAVGACVRAVDPRGVFGPYEGPLRADYLMGAWCFLAICGVVVTHTVHIFTAAYTIVRLPYPIWITRALYGYILVAIPLNLTCFAIGTAKDEFWWQANVSDLIAAGCAIVTLIITNYACQLLKHHLVPALRVQENILSSARAGEDDHVLRNALRDLKKFQYGWTTAGTLVVFASISSGLTLVKPDPNKFDSGYWIDSVLYSIAFALILWQSWIDPYTMLGRGTLTTTASHSSNNPKPITLRSLEAASSRVSTKPQDAAPSRTSTKLHDATPSRMSTKPQEVV